MQRQIIVLFALWKITIYIFCLALFCLGLSIVRFCSKTSRAQPGLEYLHFISTFFLHKSDGISNCVCWAHLQSSQLAATNQLQTPNLTADCSVFVLFWNIENRDGIIGTLGNTEEHRDQICIVWRRQGWACWFHDSSGGRSIMFNLFVILRTDLDSPKRSLVMRLIRREHSQSHLTTRPKSGTGRKRISRNKS